MGGLARKVYTLLPQAKIKRVNHTENGPIEAWKMVIRYDLAQMSPLKAATHRQSLLSSCLAEGAHGQADTSHGHTIEMAHMQMVARLRDQKATNAWLSSTHLAEGASSQVNFS